MAGETKLKIICDLGSADVKVENLSGKKPRTIKGIPIKIKADGSLQLIS